MKNTLIKIAASIFLITSALGGTTAKQTLDTYPTSAWFAGANVEYLDTAETELYTLRVGQRFTESAHFSWALFGEVGYATIGSNDFVPIQFAGEARYHWNDTISLYAGAGVGTSYLDLDLKTSSDWYLTYQTFAGIGFRISESLTLDVGARYTMLHDAPVDDQVSYGAGVTWTF